MSILPIPTLENVMSSCELWSVSMARFLSLRSRDQAFFKSLYSHSAINYIGCISKTAQLLCKVELRGRVHTVQLLVEKTTKTFLCQMSRFPRFLFLRNLLLLLSCLSILDAAFQWWEPNAMGVQKLMDQKYFLFCFGCCYTLWCCCCW